MRSKIVLLLIVCFAVINSAQELSENKENIKIETVDNIGDFIKLHPGTHVEELTPSIHELRGVITYTLGARVSGDQLVGKAEQHTKWPNAQNVALTLQYPTAGVGAIVTYVFISIDQSTNLGRAYVTRGGLHQHNITIVVESYNTFYINCTAQIYGIK